MSNLRIYRVDGMACEGCVRAITIAIRKSDISAFVHVDVRGGTVSVAGTVTDDQIRQAIERAGYAYRGSAQTQLLDNPRACGESGY